MLIFNDTRRFGFIDLLRTKKISKKNYISRLGMDALDMKLNELRNKYNITVIN